MAFDEVRECPECGALAEESRWDEFEEGLAFPNCPNGWNCPGLMDTPKSAKVSADGVKSGEERKTEAAEVFG
jgi:hypothetical protein